MLGDGGPASKPESLASADIVVDMGSLGVSVGD
jgi:hypothetical protein